MNLNINNKYNIKRISETLASVGICLYDNNDNIKNTIDVLRELKKKWRFIKKDKIICRYICQQLVGFKNSYEFELNMGEDYIKYLKRVENRHKLYLKKKKLGRK